MRNCVALVLILVIVVLIAMPQPSTSRRFRSPGRISFKRSKRVVIKKVSKKKPSKKIKQSKKRAATPAPERNSLGSSITESKGGSTDKSSASSSATSRNVPPTSGGDKSSAGESKAPPSRRGSQPIIRTAPTPILGGGSNLAPKNTSTPPRKTSVSDKVKKDRCAWPTANPIFPSLNEKFDWTANWEAERTISKSFVVDPKDPRAMMRGTGKVVIKNCLMKMTGEPRFYVQAASSSPGWNNIEMTAYASLAGGKVESKFQSYSGITLVTRSNHNSYKDDPCLAHSYYARLYFSTGEVAVQKEFRHGSDGTIYTKAIRNTTHLIDKALYTKGFVGLKSVVRTNKDGVSVNLRVYVDIKSNGVPGVKSNWELKMEYNDKDEWVVHNVPTKSLKCKYPYAPNKKNYASPVLRAGKVSFFRSDGVKDLQWKFCSIREIAPV